MFETVQRRPDCADSPPNRLILCDFYSVGHPISVRGIGDMQVPSVEPVPVAMRLEYALKGAYYGTQVRLKIDVN